MHAEFWDFVYERDATRYRRDTGKHPWTLDDIIANNHFTNVHRRHDPTSVIVEDWLRGFEWDDETLPTVVVCRMSDRRETVRHVTKVMEASDGDLIQDGIIDGPRPFFTCRHQTKAIKHVIEAVQHLYRGEGPFDFELVDAETNAQRGKLVQEIPWVGPFFAWQIIADLEQARLIPELDDVILGPGAKAGLRIIEPCISARYAQGVVRQLRDEQPPLTGGVMNLADVEHALCEYSRYYGIKHGLIRGQRRSWAA